MQNAIIYPAANIVLDLETLSTKPNAVIISIGAVALSAKGLIVAEYHQAITSESQPERHIDIDTMAWWDQQSDEAKAASLMATDGITAVEALRGFAAWVHEYVDTKSVKVWGNGSSFDNVILASLYAGYRGGQLQPWNYWNDRDMRTLLDQHPHARDVGQFEGVKHHALHDARHEAKQLAKVLQAPAVVTGPAEVERLSALIDGQYALLKRAKAAMTALHGAALSIDESGGNLDARIPYSDFERFVDEHAALLYAMAQSERLTVHALLAQAPAAPAVDAALPSWWPDFIRCVAELPERNSPEGEPDAMIATAEELGSCALAAQAKEGGAA